MSVGEARKVLFLDDSEDALEALKVMLRQTNYEAHFFTDPFAAIELLKEDKSFATIISDIKMPQLSGYEFLKEAEKLSPLSTRLHMSSLTDRDTVLKSLHENQIYDFIEKPLHKNRVLASLQKAVERFVWIQERGELNKKLEEQNQKLQDWNKVLDEKVRAQTLELQMRDKIMQHLCGSQPVQDPFSMVSEFADYFFDNLQLRIFLRRGVHLERVFSRENSVSTDSEKLENVFLPENVKCRDLEGIKQNLEQNFVPQGCSEVLAVPLTHCHKVVGVAVLCGSKLSFEVREQFERLVALLSLLAHDQLVLENLDEITSTVEQLNFGQHA